MFFIAKGKCSVFVNDKFANERQESKLVRVLDPGSHFGEISLLYRTKRSATVIAKYYLTCAKLDRANYNELLQIYPNLNELIKSHFLLYDDPLRIWMEISMNQIPFFEHLSQHIKNEIIFSMKRRELELGSFLY